jgi:type IV secretion system protein VirB4
MGNQRLLAVVVFEGIPFETTPHHILEKKNNHLNSVLKEISKINAPNLAQWNHIIKRKVNLEFDYKCKNKFVSRFTQKYLSQFQDGNFFETRYAVSFVMKYEDLDEGIEAMDALLDFVQASLPEYEPLALGVDAEHGYPLSDIGSYLAELVNGHADAVPLSSNLITNTMLTGNLHFGYDVAELRPAKGGKRYATFYDLREFPEESKKGMWNFLLSVPYEFVLTASFIHFTALKAINLIDKQVNKLQSSSNAPGHYLDELKGARGYVGTGQICFGDFHASLVVFGNTPKEAQDSGTKLTSQFIAAGLGARFIRSTDTGLFTFASQLPGSEQRMYSEPKTTMNLANCFSMNNLPTGKQYGNPIGDGTALMPLKTKSDTVYFLNTHYSHPAINVTGEKHAGHFTVLGATGTGKTTLEGTIAAFALRFEPDIFAIDFNNSMQLFLEAFGAEYFDIRNNEPTGINPFQFEENPSPSLKSFLYEVIGACGRQGLEPLTADEERKIKSAVDIVLTLPFEERCFSMISSVLPPVGNGSNSIGDRLAKWQRVNGGKLAWALDNSVNRFDPRKMRRIGFNTTEILKKDHPAVEPILACLFHLKDMMQRDGNLMMSLVEEFWVPCMFPTTAEQIKGTLKAGRIKSEFMGLISQSPEDAIRCPIFADIIQQTPTKIFLPNPEATFENYKLCGLNEREFEDFAALDKTSRTFLIKQSQQSLFAKLDLHGFDEFLPIISGTWEDIALMKKLKEEVGNDPDVWIPLLIEQIKARKKHSKPKAALQPEGA